MITYNVPEILQPIFEMGELPTATTDFICLETGIVTDMTVRKSGTFMTNNVFGHTASLRHPLRVSDHANSLELYYFRNHKPVKVWHDDPAPGSSYLFPHNSYGDGEPLKVHAQHPYLFGRLTLKCETMSFYWMDESRNYWNRTNGPCMVSLVNVEVKPNYMSWDHVSYGRLFGTQLLQHRTLYDRMTQMDPFANPFFEDSQDELEYLSVTEA